MVCGLPSIDFHELLLYCILSIFWRVCACALGCYSSRQNFRSFTRRGEHGRRVPPFHRCSTLWSHSRAPEVKVYLCLSSIAGLTSSSRPWSPRKREPEKLGQHFKPEETETRRGKRRRGTRDVETSRRWRRGGEKVGFGRLRLFFGRLC